MRKIIAIGECSLDIIFTNDVPGKSCPGGRILNSARLLGKQGHETYFVGEAAADHVGDIIVGELEKCNVITRSIDRFTDGVTPVTLLFHDDEGRLSNRVRYERYAPQSFDVVWPRIDQDDIVVFGGIYALDERVRARMFDIVKYARDRKAIIVYVPGFETDSIANLTHVKPAILESLETADLVLTVDRDLSVAFAQTDGARAYAQNISFYCFNHINIDFDASEIVFYNRKKVASAAVGTGVDRKSWAAGALAGVIDALLGYAPGDIVVEDPGKEVMGQIVANSAAWGNSAADNL